MKSIVLIGMPGSGKTTTGKFLSDKLSISFYDTDIEIENSEHKTIPQIFEQNGEKYFRQKEENIIKKLPYQNTVIALGGGTFENPKTQEFLLNTGTVIYLKTSEQTIYKRLEHDNTRPLLQGNPKENIKKLLLKREKNYKLAHFSVLTDNKTVEQIADEILKCVNLK